MSRLKFQTAELAWKTMDEICGDIMRRITASPRGNCPAEVTAAFLRLCVAQSCGKCVPCRIGLSELANILDAILEGRATLEDLALFEETAHAIKDSADCAIGFEAARLALDGLAAFRDDYLSHIEKGCCAANFDSIPCVALCPAHVDVPGYIALIGAGRYADAVRLIRKDNPFPSVCGLICEHPCESHCRRGIVDDAINIRGLKRFAIDNAGSVPAPKCADATGKTVAVVGGGPAGLTAAYFLRLMGHEVTVYEKMTKLGGMLRYGIPPYRLPNEYLDADIDVILSTGVKVKTGVNIGTDISFEELRRQYDSVYISIGAHEHKRLGIDGEEGRGVMSAVELLRGIGDGHKPDFRGKSVVVIGGGNVAMDATRTSMRLGAKKVTCVYRRRQIDMTALPDEIEGAIAEGCEIMQLMAPVRIERDEEENVTALIVQPQVIGEHERGRATPRNADKPEARIPCDMVIMAIGQEVDSAHFAAEGIPVKWEMLETDNMARIPEKPGAFAGGDCVFGPATVIRAIEAGKVAAANIDSYFGMNTEITADVEIPPASYFFKPACGRANMRERAADERKNDFKLMELGLSEEEAKQECSRCLRCDHYGCGSIKGGRQVKW